MAYLPTAATNACYSSITLPPLHLPIGRTIVASFIWLAATNIALTQAPLLEVEVPKGRFVGMPVHWNDREAVLLEPTGRFQFFDVQELTRHQLLKEYFQPQSLVEARSYLQSELGPRFETVVTGPYVIAAPVGEATRWQSRFNTLYAGYTRYFEVRGWKVRRPEFPLLVTVFATREEFLNYCSVQAVPIPNGAVGCYFPKTNRCVLYQIPGWRGTNWSETEATVVHEAVHQLAYNTGMHERLFTNPLWFVEGLATMFEQPAVYELGVNRSNLETRMHPEKVAALQPLLKNANVFQATIRDLVASDELFRSDPTTAYSLGWALTFYFAERMPSQYQNYIQVQSRKGFGAYPRDDRIRDFENAFGTNAAMLAVQMDRLLRQGN